MQHTCHHIRNSCMIYVQMGHQCTVTVCTLRASTIWLHVRLITYSLCEIVITYNLYVIAFQCYGTVLRSVV